MRRADLPANPALFLGSSRTASRSSIFHQPTPRPATAAAMPSLRLPASATPSPKSALIKFRPYQEAAFRNRTNGIEVWLWARQTGKSFTLAAWAVDRLITNPGRTVTILSNSRNNGSELNRKCAQVCDLMGQAFRQADLSDDQRFEKMRFETRITIHGKVGRILVLAANPLTARSFSGDLILDEFAFHEDSQAIWNAAHPILDSNPDYLCRIASTPNGKFNEFYRLVTDPGIPQRKVTRTDAWTQGCLVYHPVTRASITPEEARALAHNKRAYDQNYECVFEDQNSALLTYELIQIAERDGVGVVCEQEWTPRSLACLTLDPDAFAAFGASSPAASSSNASTQPIPKSEVRKPVREWLEGAANWEEMFRLISTICNGSVDRMELLAQSNYPIALTDRFTFDELEMMCAAPYSPSNSVQRGHSSTGGRAYFVGVDVGRNNDRTVITVLERVANAFVLRALLRLADTRLPQQQLRLEQILRLPGVNLCKIDMTGLGLGLYEYTMEKFGARIQGVNFASTVTHSSGSVRVTEALATALLQAFEDRSIQIPIDHALREDLRKPERLVNSTGRVSIAATRDEAGHADHFWSLALALSAAQTPIQPPLQYHAWKPVYKSRMPLL